MGLSLKDQRLCDNPYEKYEAYGTEKLTDAELLAILLRSGTREKTALELARELLSGHQNSLLNLIDLSDEELQTLPGIGKVKAMNLKCLAEIAKRMTMTKRFSEFDAESSASVAAYYMESMRHKTRETLVIAMFDSKSRLVGDQTVTVGTLNTAMIAPREIFSYALRENAAFIIMLHNHPSGDAKPSENDLNETKRVYALGKELQVYLLDHIIIGDNKYFSFRERGLLE